MLSIGQQRKLLWAKGKK